MIAQQLSLEDALAARDKGMSLVLYHSASEYREALENAIRVLASIPGREFIADALRDACGDPPMGTSPNVVGAVVNAAAKAGLIEQVGYAKSSRVVGHANLVRVWRGRRP